MGSTRDRKLVAALDLGTTSSRCIVFDRAGLPRGIGRRDHRQILPAPGWVEHDALEIAANMDGIVADALADAGVGPSDIAAVGITNQRETAIVWDRATGLPVCNAIVWQDTRTAQFCDELVRGGHGEMIRQRTGLPVATYFSGPKIRWILDNVSEARAQAEAGDLIFGTIDSWVIWNLTGGWSKGGPSGGGVHVTDVSNASRTMLMDLHTLDWNQDVLAALDIPASLLPR